MLPEAEKIFNQQLTGFEMISGPYHTLTLDKVNILGNHISCRRQAK